MATVTTEWRPIKVLVLDIEDLTDAIRVNPRYKAAWVLVRERGRPRGMVKIPLADGEVSAETLLDAISGLPALASAGPSVMSPDVTLPRVSVVVSTLFGRVAELHECLASLAAMRYPDFEVIVVDNRGSLADSIELEGVRVVHEPRRGLAAARNCGIAEATGEVIAFTDDDVVVQPDWLMAIVARLLCHPEEAGVMGLAIPRELETRAQVALENYYGGFGPRVFQPVSHRLRANWGTGLFSPPLVDAIDHDGTLVRTFSLYAAGTFGPGANMAFRTQVLRDIGGFDTALGPGTPAEGGEELYLFMRLAQLGYSLGFEPASVVSHTHRQDEDGLRGQIFAYGVGWTALLTAAVVDDPRHLARMLATVPRAARVFGNRLGWRVWTRKAESAQDSGGAADDQEARLIAELARLELRGKLVGPLHYARSRHGSHS